MNSFPQQGFGPPPSPVSRYAPARSPGPHPGVGGVGQADLTSYMSSGANGADPLNYAATSPQSTGFAHSMVSFSFWYLLVVYLVKTVFG